MKKAFLFPLLAFLITQGMTAQVKLGDNPQNIDPASLFELESSDQVLVITRVSTAELQAITPSMGALAYNTDEKCLFYHNGDVWVNLCEALGRAFTTDPIQNEFPTIVITPLEESINFEVGEIRSENIVDFSIVSQDIRNNSINSDKLADASVGAAELQDNAVTERNLDLVDITLSDFSNDVPFLLQADLVAASIFYDNTASGLDGLDIQAAIDALSSGLNDVELRAVGDGTYIFMDSDGTTTTFDLNASALPFDNTSNGFTATDVQGAIEEIQGSSSDNQQITEFEFEEGIDQLTLSIEEAGTQVADLSRLNQSAIQVPVARNPSNYSPEASNVEGHLAGIDEALVIAGGGNPNDELNQSFEIIGANLELSDAGGTLRVPLADLGSNDQTASQVEVAANPVNYSPVSADVEAHLAAIDQALITTGSGEIPDNELITDVQLEGTDLIITEAGIDNTVSLAGLSGGTPDAQNVSFTPTPNTVSDNVQDAIEELQSDIDSLANAAPNPTDEIQDLTLDPSSNILGITNNPDATPIDLSPYLDDQNAAEVTVTLEPENYFPPGPDVEAHLIGIDAALTTLGANPSDEIQNLQLISDTLSITNNPDATPIDLSPYLDDQNAAEVTVTLEPENYFPPSPDVEAHLNGIDAALTTLGANPSDEIQNLQLITDTLSITNNPDATLIDLSPYLDDQNAAEVSFEPAGNTSSNNVQTAIEEIQTEIDGLTNSNSDLASNDLIQSDPFRTYEMTGNLLFTGGGNFGIGNGANPPSNKLHVAGAIRSEGILNSDGSLSSPSYRFNGDTNTGIYRPAADELALVVGGGAAIELNESAADGLQVSINGSIELNGPLIDQSGNLGNSGDVLTASAAGVQWAQPRVSVWGKIDASGLRKGNGISDVNNSTTGNYTISFSSPFPDIHYTVQLTVIGNYRIYVVSQSDTSLVIEIRDQVDVLTDANFFVTIVD